MMVHPSAVLAAFISTGVISLAPNILLFLFPNYGSGPHSHSSATAMLSLGQALAVGGLLGDVFLHTLPECFTDAHPHMHQHHHHHHGSENNIGLRVIFGFSVFLILDIFVRSIEKTSGGHSHSNNGEKGLNDKCTNKKQSWRLLLSSAVLLNLLGDACHNFTDGLAIGATFSLTQIPHSSEEIMSWTTAFSLLKSRGGLASISVFLHEIPHELGDFATLVRAGCSRNMAIGLQFLTSIAAFAGTAFGLFSADYIEGLGHEVLLPFTAGGFLYLACVTILPDVLETESNVWLRTLQIGSFLLGIGFMHAVAELEEMESMGQQVHSEL